MAQLLKQDPCMSYCHADNSYSPYAIYMFWLSAYSLKNCKASHQKTYFLCYVNTATGWGFTSCHWHKKQAKMEHFLSTLALRGHSNLANLSFLFLFLFDFQNFSIYNVLFIVGCRGERTVRIRKVEGSIPFVSTTSEQSPLDKVE